MNDQLTLQAISDAPGAAVRTLRERCHSLGLPTWRCDRTGAVIEDPIDTGAAGLLLSAHPITRLVNGAARTWAALPESATPEVTEFFPGCWAIPLLEMRRGQRTGMVVALAFSQASLTEEVFLSACRAAHLDAKATQRSFAPRARYTRDSARTARDMLLLMVADMARLQEHDATVSGFTRQLTDSFETIDLLYALGRSMCNLDRPAEFVASLCDRVRSTLPFGWVAAWFEHDDRLGGLTSKLILKGQTSLQHAAITRTLGRFVSSAKDGRSGIMTQIDGQELPDGGQLLVQPVQRGGRTVGALVAGDKHGDDPQVSSYDIQLLEAAAGYIGAFLDNAVLYADQQALFVGTLEALTASIDAKDRYTCGHSQRVAQLAWQLALAAGLSAENAERIRIAGLVHDVGKIGVPEAVLTKSGRLTEEEFAAIKQHPAIGHRILKDIRLLEDILPGVLYHHERWDGKGYPEGLAGDTIPFIARIIALADTFDAMSSNRSYRSALKRDQVLEEIRRCAGGQFDASLAEAFLKLDFTEYDRMVSRHAAQPQHQDVRVRPAA